MRIGLTGYMPGANHPGFVGSWLVRELEGHGHTVTPIIADVREPLSLVAKPYSVDLVVHLAARVGRLLCEQNPRDVIDTNVWGTMNVARACKTAGVPLLYVSSSEAAWSGNLYGLTKRWGEEVADLVLGNDDDLLTVQLFMPYGPGHPPGHGRAALTNWVWQAMNGGQLTVHRGTERPWCWVGDTVTAIRLLCEQHHNWQNLPPRIDIGRTDNVLPSLDVAELALIRYGADGARIVETDVPAGVIAWKRPGGNPNTLATLGWRPQVELPDGMDRVHAWLVENRAAFV